MQLLDEYISKSPKRAAKGEIESDADADETDADADTAAATNACPQLPPAGSNLALPPGELRPGRYVFAVSVSKASGETASAGVAITVVAGSVPVVSVAPPAAAKQSANTALRLVGSALLESASASQLELAWSCDGES